MYVTFSRVPYRSGHHEELNVVTYSADLKRNYFAHISVERTQRGKGVAYHMKYSFKLPKPVDVRVETREERGSLYRNVARDNIRTDFVL